MDLPNRSSEDSKRVAKAAEEEPTTSIDQCLVDAVLHPQFRKKLLGMEAKIQQVLENPNLEKVEFPECHTFHLKSLADKLARHYRLESCCKEHRAFARKTPDSKIPSVTLSGIPELNRKGNLPILNKRSNSAASDSKIPSVTLSGIPELNRKDNLPILNKRSSGAASSSNSPAPKLTDPVKRWEEEYYKARERIFNEPMPAVFTAPLVSNSTPPVASSSILPVDSSSSSLAVSRSTSPIHNGIGEEVDQDNDLSDMHAATNPVNNPGVNMVSSSILPVVSSSRSLPVSRSTSPIDSGIGAEVDQDGLNDMNTATNPVHNPGTCMASSFRSLSVSRSASPIYSEIGEEVDQDGLSDMHTATNPVHNPGANMNDSLTNSMYGGDTEDFNQVPTTGQQPLPMQNTASTLWHQAMQYEPIIQQPQMMQYEPSIAQPHMHIPYYNYYPYDTSSGQYNPAYPYGVSTSPYYACNAPRLAWVSTSSSQYNPAYPYGVSTSPYYACNAPRLAWVSTSSGQYNPAYPYGVSTSPYYACNAPRLAWVKLVQPFSQEPMRYQAGIAQPPANNFIQNYQGAVRPRRTSYGRGRCRGRGRSS